MVKSKVAVIAMILVVVIVLVTDVDAFIVDIVYAQYCSYEE